jgi:Right handed beta helix region
MRKQIRRITKLALFCVSFILSTALANAATYYVATNGSDSNSCSTAQTHTTAKRTIAAGMACLAPGDTLVIKAGTYDESLDNLVPSGISAAAPTTIQNYQTDAVTIRKTGSCPINRILVQGNRSYIKWLGTGVNIVLDANNLCTAVVDADEDPGPNRGFTFDGITIQGAINSGIFLEGTGHLLQHNLVQNNGTRNFDHGLYYGKGGSSIIQDNTFQNNYAYGIHQFLSTGNVETNSDNIYRRNTFKSNGTAGLIISNGSRNLVYNNISIGDGRITADAWGGFRAYAPAANNQFLNNTIYNWGTGSGIEIEPSVTGTVIRNNIIWGASGTSITDRGSSTLISNNVTTNPSFINASSGDLRLQPGSTAIDVGVTLSAVTSDFSGAPRPVGSGYDIGAYEYQSSVTTVAPPQNLRIVP